MLCALIMAGGKGTRFWPISTEDKPKQFLNLISEKTMIQMTIDRIKPMIPIERIFVCTSQQYVDLLSEQIPDLPIRNIIIEPEGRNTAPCIALSALVINRYYKNANMIVLPSDHLIRDEEEFRKILTTGNKFVDMNPKSIVTLGMKPSRPEIGYGYIKYTDDKQVVDNRKIIKVESFVEKPSLEKAKQYLQESKYLWNGGMFLWNTNEIIDEIKKFEEDTYEALQHIRDISEEKLQEEINNNYNKTRAISVDYAILEKSDNIFVIESEFGWDDIGSWEAIERYREKDTNNNIYIGNIKANNTKNNIIASSSNKVIISDLSDIYLVENDGYIIIGKKENISEVRNYNMS
ncbi:mannose-1-phosphate guanylyltransferase [Inconstantimicrobium mannanitabidum]|uniref:Mannose-1-phosphate guanylyltransferase n=1 Tax=Inconstantimicrobium mannanitabidum TaxID=1604901 RepID=A0ACB5RF59_9CLOT|nr:mannose-1-phosphate guanylyltransferase [Clostridium sp. TW13]GKX67806.1 mannose-1-phosphate guanylyltransferase [Clostridium sp. TW13]